MKLLKNFVNTKIGVVVIIFIVALIFGVGLRMGINLITGNALFMMG